MSSCHQPYNTPNTTHHLGEDLVVSTVVVGQLREGDDISATQLATPIGSEARGLPALVGRCGQHGAHAVPHAERFQTRGHRGASAAVIYRRDPTGYPTPGAVTPGTASGGTIPPTAPILAEGPADATTTPVLVADSHTTTRTPDVGFSAVPAQPAPRERHPPDGIGPADPDSGHVLVRK